MHAPFTIAANWTQTADHDAHLFVPPENETTGPAPFIKYTCTPDKSSSAEAYPFVCFDGDEQASGDEVATIYKLLPGTYEYWIELWGATPAGELSARPGANRGGQPRRGKRVPKPGRRTFRRRSCHS